MDVNSQSYYYHRSYCLFALKFLTKTILNYDCPQEIISFILQFMLMRLEFDEEFLKNPSFVLKCILGDENRSVKLIQGIYHKYYFAKIALPLTQTLTSRDNNAEFFFYFGPNVGHLWCACGIFEEFRLQPANLLGYTSRDHGFFGVSFSGSSELFRSDMKGIDVSTVSSSINMKDLSWIGDSLIRLIFDGSKGMITIMEKNY